MMIWLSFSDPSRPDGFLGVVIVDVDAEVYAPDTMKKALAACSEAGLNPGGEAIAFFIHPALEKLYENAMWRLLTREEVQDLGERFSAAGGTASLRRFD